MTNLEELAEQLPRGLRSDWDGTNHYELQCSGRDFWWLIVRDIDFQGDGSLSDTEEGKRLGLIMDIAAEVSRLRDEGNLSESIRSKELRSAHTALDSAGICAGGSLSTRVVLLVAERDKLQETLVSKHGGEPLALLDELDAEREAHEATKRALDPPICRLQFPDGSVPSNAREAAEGWKRWYEAAVKERDQLTANLQFTDEANESIGKQNDMLKRRLAEACNVIEPQLRSLLTRAAPLVCVLHCRQGHETEHRELCREIREALKGGGE